MWDWRWLTNFINFLAYFQNKNWYVSWVKNQFVNFNIVKKGNRKAFWQLTRTHAALRALATFRLAAPRCVSNFIVCRRARAYVTSQRMSRFLVTAAEVPRWGRLPCNTAAVASGGRICWLILPRSQMSTMNLRSQAPKQGRWNCDRILLFGTFHSPTNGKSTFCTPRASYQIDAHVKSGRNELLAKLMQR